jgi:hypothetical protein
LTAHHRDDGTYEAVGTEEVHLDGVASLLEVAIEDGGGCRHRGNAGPVIWLQDHARARHEHVGASERGLDPACEGLDGLVARHVERCCGSRQTAPFQCGGDRLADPHVAAPKHDLVSTLRERLPRRATEAAISTAHDSDWSLRCTRRPSSFFAAATCGPVSSSS